MSERAAGDVACWHNSDVSQGSLYVRCWGRSGKDLLAVSISPFDQKATSRGRKLHRLWMLVFGQWVSLIVSDLRTGKWLVPVAYLGNADTMSEMHDDGKIKRHRLGNPQRCVPGTIGNTVEK